MSNKRILRIAKSTRLAVIVTVGLLLFVFAVAFFMGCGADNNDEATMIDISYKAGTGGYIDGECDQTLKRGNSATAVSAVPDEGYEFVRWSDGKTEAARQDGNVTAGFTVTAEFGKKTYAVRYDSECNGKVLGKSSQTVEHGKDATEVSAVPDEGYEFAEWSDGKTEAMRCDRNITDKITVSARFRKKRYYVFYTTDGNGKVIGEWDQTVEHGKDATEVSAVPNDGYEFVKWSDGKTTATRRDCNITAGITISAEFGKKTIYKLNYRVDGGGGTIEGDLTQNVAHGEDGMPVKAVPDPGYVFDYWSCFGIDKNAERIDRNVTKNMYVVAVFRRIEYHVTYKASEGGSVRVIEESYPIYYGGQSQTVRAEPYDLPERKYVFICWSDGLETPERTEQNVTCDMEFTAYFGHSAEYKVNNGVGGTIKGKSYQKEPEGVDFTEVEAVPDEGYVFDGWSDLRTDGKRKDENKRKRNIEYTAYFVPVERTFTFDYGIADGTPMAKFVTINRNDLQLDGHPTPTVDGYSFEGWYADKDHKLKVINSDGRYMLGYYGLSLETDALYARFRQESDNSPVFKVLLVCVSELHAKLYSARNRVDNTLYDVNYLMTAIDRESCMLLYETASNYSNEWLQGLTNVEIDIYFTTEQISEKYILYERGIGSYCISSALPETRALYTSYHSVLSIWNINDYDRTMRYSDSCIDKKYSCLYLEDLYRRAVLRQIEITDLLEIYKTGSANIELQIFIVNQFFEPFISTCQGAYKKTVERPFLYFYEVCYEFDYFDRIEVIKLFLTGKLPYDGKKVGIPPKFWLGECNELLLSYYDPYYDYFV